MPEKPTNFFIKVVLTGCAILTCYGCQRKPAPVSKGVLGIPTNAEILTLNSSSLGSVACVTNEDKQSGEAFGIRATITRPMVLFISNRAATKWLVSKPLSDLWYTMPRIAFSADGKLLGLAQGDSLSVLDASNGVELFQQNVLASVVAFLNDKSLLVGCMGGELVALSLGSSTIRRIHKFSAPRVWNLVISDDGNSFAASASREVVIGETSGYSIITTASLPVQVEGIAFSGESAFFGAVTRDGEVTIWNTRTLNKRTVSTALRGEVLTISGDKDNRFTIFGRNSVSIVSSFEDDQVTSLPLGRSFTAISSTKPIVGIEDGTNRVYLMTLPSLEQDPINYRGTNRVTTTVRNAGNYSE